MAKYQTLYDGITKAAWGYFFLYFNININIDAGSISLLPSFIGYFLFLKAIDILKDEEKELTLLKTFGAIMAVYEIFKWLGNCFAFNIDDKLQFIGTIASLINLYFHFQFITNLASIAAKYQQEGYEQDKKLLKYRTIQTVMLTISLVITRFALIFNEFWIYISGALAIVIMVVCILLMKALFDLRKCLRTDDEIQIPFTY